jgi:TfoX/Sxy family transcriptional regulator of competence genes
MPYNTSLAERIRAKLAPYGIFEEKKMFGGVGYLRNGNMAVGVHKDHLIVRVGTDAHDAALKRKGARVFDITGKPMSGWVMVSKEGCAADKQLDDWITLALEFVDTLPPK